MSRRTVGTGNPPGAAGWPRSSAAQPLGRYCRDAGRFRTLKIGLILATIRKSMCRQRTARGHRIILIEPNSVLPHRTPGG